MLFFKAVLKHKTVIAIAAVSVLIIVYAIKIGVAAFERSSKETLSIILYHSVNEDEDQHGEYSVSPKELEEDLKYLKENGYTCITSKELIDYVYSSADLPQKAVMLTFDDGCLDNMTYVYPLLEKYDMKAVFSIVGEFCDREESKKNRDDSSYLNWAEVKKLYQSGKVDIACHSNSLHTLNNRMGAMINADESYTDYRSVFLSDTNNFLRSAKDKAQIVPSIYTYPYGLICEESKNLIKTCGFKISLGCEERVNRLSREESSLWCLGRFNRQSGVSTEDFMKKVF